MHNNNKPQFVKYLLFFFGLFPFFNASAYASGLNSANQKDLLPPSTATSNIVDLIGGIGYSNWKFDEGDSYNGYNFNFSALFHRTNFGTPINFVIGPLLKYENVSDEETILNMTLNRNASTLQLGIEGGVKFSLSSLFNLYTTLFGSYGIVNEMTAKISSGNQGLTAHLPVNDVWQLGAQVRGIFNINQYFGIGAGLALASGYMNVGDFVFMGQNIEGNENNYMLVSANVFAAVYL